MKPVVINSDLNIDIYQHKVYLHCSILYAILLLLLLLWFLSTDIHTWVANLDINRYC